MWKLFMVFVLAGRGKKKLTEDAVGRNLSPIGLPVRKRANYPGHNSRNHISRRGSDRSTEDVPGDGQSDKPGFTTPGNY